MDSAKPQAIPTPPSLMKSLMAGFDAIGNHISVILFSILLDSFLWFGPRLRIVEVLQPLFRQIAAIGLNSVSPELQNPETIRVLQATAEEINLFSALRTFPVGIPSLMVGRSTLAMPAGNPLTWQLPSFEAAFLAWLILLVIGLILGSLYFNVVAQAAITGKVSFRQAINEWLWTSTQVLLLSMLYVMLLTIIILPLSCLFTIFLMSGLGFEQLSLLSILIAAGFLVWLIIPLFFSPHGIFVNGHAVWNSLKASIRLTRLTFSTTGMLLLIILVLSEGLNILWNMPPENSWFTLIGIAGHAFVSTSLLAASFIYYRDAIAWIQQILQRTKLSVA